jgi:N-acetylglucosamine kinase-like BadF-type ATPase
MTALLVGIDAGASHTEVVLGEEKDRVLGRWRGGPGALRPGAESDTVRGWAEAIAQVLERVRRPGERMAVVVGAAGAGNDTSRLRAEQLLADALGPTARVRVTTDGEIALEAALPDGSPGIVIAAGSGSIGFARDPQGVLRRVGGLGPRIGDEGSGYALARAGLATAGQALDGRGPQTALAARLLGATGSTSLAELVSWVARSETRDVASLAVEVCRSANDGDAEAQRLVREAGEDLARYVDALLPHFGDLPTVRVAVSGGILGTDSPVRAQLVEALAKREVGLAFRDEPTDPVLGALRLAASLL